MNSFATMASILGVTSLAAVYYTQSLNLVSDDDFLAMPDGRLYHKSCIHVHDDHFTVERTEEGSLVNGEMHAPCKYESRMQVKEQ